MALDLSALEDKPTDKHQPVAHSGKPMEILLSNIEEDPNQPRIEFSKESMKEMTASIKDRGVKTPVSVRPHPIKSDKWILNYGARRYRGSIAAGKETIPAFVDASHDHYDQVIENIQRENLTAMELALFIKKRIDKGEKKSVIAKKLSKDGAIITQHLSLIDAPACIEEAYNTSKCTSPKTLYELRSLHDKYPEQVEQWYINGAEITRRTVAELAGELKGNKKPIIPEVQPIETSIEQIPGNQLIDSNNEKFGHDQISVSSNTNEQKDSTINNSDSKPSKTKKADNNTDDNQANKDHGELTSWPRGQTISDPQRINKPLLLIEYEGRSAAVILNRRPSSPNLLHIRYEDGSGDAEVDAAQCKINVLTDTDK
jgi:ParB family chromosome partitioning protein